MMYYVSSHNGLKYLTDMNCQTNRFAGEVHEVSGHTVAVLCA